MPALTQTRTSLFSVTEPPPLLAAAAAAVRERIRCLWAPWNCPPRRDFRGGQLWTSVVAAHPAKSSLGPLVSPLAKVRWATAGWKSL